MRNIKVLLIRYWRESSFIIITVVGTVSARYITFKGGVHLDWFEALYHTLKLFFLNVEILPISGPLPLLVPFVLIHFLAPLLLADFIFTTMRKILYRPEQGIKHLSGHIIIAGMGKMGNSLYECLSREGLDVVVVEKDEKCKYLAPLRTNYQKFVVGDTAVKSTMRKANVMNASMLIAVSGDDVANIDACFNAHVMSVDRCRCFLQVKDIYLHERLMENEQLAGKNVTIINLYESVAKIVVDRIKGKFDLNLGGYVFVIAGFGNFGKMISKVLLADEEYVSGEANQIVIIDKDKSIMSQDHFSYLKDASQAPAFMIADIRDTSVWRGLREKNKDRKMVVIIATDNDASNVNAAIFVSKQLQQDVLIMTRLFRNSCMLQEDNQHIVPMVLSDEVNKMILRWVHHPSGGIISRKSRRRARSHPEPPSDQG